MEQKQVRTRFAPSPTGYMHVGNLRTALFAYLFARHYNGKFILRIEDTDQKRFVDGATDVIFETLKQTGLTYDEGPDIGGNYGPYKQSERKEIYQKYAQILLEKGVAYYCFCKKDSDDTSENDDEMPAEQTYGHHCDCCNLSKEEIAKRLKTESFVIRQKMPKDQIITFHDEVYGDISIDSNTLDDQVLIKSDGLPTYNFANVIDDHLMEITHIIRGKEYVSSTPKYQLLYDAFGWESPKVMHVAVIMGQNPDGSVSKLSKRHGAVSFANLVEQGYLPQAIINYIVLLGWSPKQEQEIYSLQELISLFTADGILKTDSIFDYKKLAWMNSHYIKELSHEEFVSLSQKFIKLAPKCVQDKWEFASNLAQSRISTFAEIPGLFAFLDNYCDFDLSLFENKKNKLTQEISLQILQDLLPEFERVETWQPEILNEIATNYATAHEMKLGAVMWAPRIAVSANVVTPGGMGEMMYLLGKETSIARINSAISRLKNM